MALQPKEPEQQAFAAVLRWELWRSRLNWPSFVHPPLIFVRSMHIRKAVITAAAPDQATIPLQRLVDRRGQDKAALQLIVEETLSAGIEEICVIVGPGNEASYREAAGEMIGSLCFVEQADPKGYADALHRASDFADGDPVLHLVGDHMYLSDTHMSCAKQLVDAASELGCSMSAVQATRESRLAYFGVVSGSHLPRRSDLYEVHRVVEKPTPTQAEQELVTAGLRAGQYLGFFGMHVLTADAFKAIGEVVAEYQSTTPSPDVGQPTLADALSKLPSRSRYLAYRTNGRRYNIGVKYGLLVAQLALGLSGTDRDLILTEMVELLALKDGNGGGEIAGEVEAGQAEAGQ